MNIPELPNTKLSNSYLLQVISDQFPKTELENHFNQENTIKAKPKTRKVTHS